MTNVNPDNSYEQPMAPQMSAPAFPHTPTRCPYTFKVLSDPAATTSEFVDRELPPNWANSATICVAMAGARASGKSFYIAVLVKLLRQLTSQNNKVAWPANENTQRQYSEHYESPLFEEMGLIKSTPGMASEDAYHRDPLIYDLGIWQVNGEDRRFFFVLRDVAGEDLENLPSDLNDLEFFRHADEVVFLFDPLRVPSVKTNLEGLVEVQELGGDPLSVLTNLLRILGDARPPLALALSKFDALQKLEDVHGSEWRPILGNYGAAFRRDNGMRFDEKDSQLVDLEVKSMLHLLKATDLLNTIRNSYQLHDSQNVRYFATSALGNAPKGRMIARTGIAPYRCLDPVLWQITKRGIFL